MLQKKVLSGCGRMFGIVKCKADKGGSILIVVILLNQYSHVPRARSSIAGKDASANTDLCRLKK